MAKQKRTWLPAPKRAKAHIVSLPGTLKDEVDTKAKELIDNVLKPMHVKPHKSKRFNYLSDIKRKWLGSKLYFVSTYRCPSPNAISPSFETTFARMQYVGNSKFSLSFMRRTGKWVVLFNRLSVDECLKAIRDDSWFMP